MTSKELIEMSNNFDEMKGIRENARIGRPLGTNDFMERLEDNLREFLS